jgi:hypothetical protein
VFFRAAGKLYKRNHFAQTHRAFRLQIPESSKITAPAAGLRKSTTQSVEPNDSVVQRSSREICGTGGALSYYRDEALGQVAGDPDGERDFGSLARLPLTDCSIFVFIFLKLSFDFGAQLFCWPEQQLIRPWIC